MARISLIAPETASPEVREIYDTTLRGKPGNVQKALAHRPEMLKNFLSFYASVGRSLDRKLYELIYLRVSLHQRMPLLHTAPRRVVETRRAHRRRLGGAQGWKLLALQRERAGRANLCRETDARPARDQRCRLRRAQETLFRSRDH